MKETFKKYWFVLLVGVLLIVGIGYFTVSKISSGEFETLKGKTVEGQDVLYSIGDTDITADDFYGRLKDMMGPAGAYQFLERMVADATVETTDELKKEAKTNADNLIASYQNYYGDQWEAVLLQALKSVGYDDIDSLEDYFLYANKSNTIVKDYINANIDSFYSEYEEQFKPRTVSHILVKFQDVKNPTEEETAKFEEVKQALANGTSFEEVASKYSDDTASAINNGSLGFMDVQTNFVESFKNAALALNEGETSEWIESDYGYHLIRIDSTNREKLMELDELYSSILTYNPTLQTNAIWEKAQELNIEFKDEELKNNLLDYMGIGGNE